MNELNGAPRANRADHPESAPASPYARVFFGLWIVTVVAIAGFRMEDPAYREQPDQWQRVKSLKSENGWLNVAGLFWFKEGANKAGADPGNEKRDGDH
jgi:uncharacterized protein